MSDLSSKEILSISDRSILFNNDQKEFDRLRRKWHPDKPNGSSDVFVHLTKVWNGEATKSNSVVIKTSNSRIIIENVRISRLICEGIIEHITPKYRWLEFSKDWNDLGDRIENADKLLKNRITTNKKKFPNEDVAKALWAFKFHHTCWAAPDDGFILLFDKPKDIVKLTDSYNLLNSFDPKTKAWIITRILTMICTLETVDLVNLSLISSSFIDPKTHDVFCLGGNECLYSLGNKVDLFPKEIEFPPNRLGKSSDKAGFDLHRLQARTIALKLFYPKIPKNLLPWFSKHQSTAIDDLRIWYDGVKKEFGEIRFTETPLTFDQVYPSST
jgi:hypothetical protein